MKIIYYLIGVVFFFGSYRVYNTERYDIKHGVYLELGSFTPFVSILLFLVAMYFFYLGKIYHRKKEYRKCPKCKETFYNLKLKNSMCPKCNIMTIDIEEYYTNNKDE